jgi:hypothetical protein
MIRDGTRPPRRAAAVLHERSSMNATTMHGHLAFLEEESLARPWLAARLGVPSAQVDRLRRAGELFGVRPPGRFEHLYPAWQFNGDGKPLESLPRVLRAAREAGLSEVELYQVMRRRVGLSGGRTLVDVLRDGGEERVLAEVRDAGNGNGR